MEKNSELGIICRELYEHPPDWDVIVDRFKSHPNHNPEKPIYLHIYAKYFSEIHLDVCLEKIVKRHSDLNIRFNPVREASETRDFVLGYDKDGRLNANYRNRDTEAFYEYDQLLDINGLPVIFEIKLTCWTKASKMKRKTVEGKEVMVIGTAIRNYLKPEVYYKRLDPIFQYFECEPGMVMIIPKDIFHNKEAMAPKGSYYKEFKRKSGVIVPFYTDRKSYRDQVVKAVLEKGLKLKLF